jgi:hypothetical protein
MDMTKRCKTCGLEKPFDPAKKKGSKASGFMGAKCWGCFLVENLGRAHKHRATKEGRAKHSVASVKSITKRLKTDRWFYLKETVSRTASRLLKQIANGKGNDASILAHFGATREEVLEYIGLQLRERGFEWALHGEQWTGDHRMPLAMAQDSNELRALCLLSNIQVFTPEVNKRKSVADKLLIAKHESKLA